MVLESTGKPREEREKNGRGVRIVEVKVDITTTYSDGGRETVGAKMTNDRCSFNHRFERI